MARSKKNMSLMKVDSRMAARKRFKITFGRALQNAPGRVSPAAPGPRAAIHPAPPRPPERPAPEPVAGQEDYLAKAEGNIGVIKSQSGVDLTEKVKELIQLAREQGYLTNEDIDNALSDARITPTDVDEVHAKLANLQIEIVDQA